MRVLKRARTNNRQEAVGGAISTPGTAALELAHSNAYKRWHHGDDAFAASRRLLSAKHGIDMQIRPEFRLKPGQSIFTIGSCFARNVEEALVKLGFHVPTFDLRVDREFYNNDVRHNAVLNRYTPHSMLSEIERTFGETVDSEDDFLPFSQDLYVYPQAALTTPNELEQLKALRSEISRTNAKVVDCDVVFITLGLTESWRDTRTGQVLNANPPPRVIMREKERFEFFNAGVTECLAAMDRLISLIVAHSNHDVRFIVTVSPVPLQTTFSGQDIIQANTRSKSVLRVVADELARTHDRVDYFPSYEMVLNSDRAFAWCDDQLHVRNVMVEDVLQKFQAAYLDG